LCNIPQSYVIYLPAISVHWCASLHASHIVQCHANIKMTPSITLNHIPILSFQHKKILNMWTSPAKTTGWTTAESVLDSWEERQIFLLLQSIQTGCGAHPAFCPWVLEAVSLGLKQLGCEPEHSPLRSAEYKNVWRYTSTPPYAFVASC